MTLRLRWGRATAAKSAERAYESGEELMVARVVMMQFLIGREDPRERGGS